MNGLVHPLRTEPDFAPIYQEILEMSTTLRRPRPVAAAPRGLGCGRSKLALDSVDPPPGGGRCNHVGVLRQRYETATVDPTASIHELGFA